MFRNYGLVLSVPGAARSSAAAFLARMPASMVGLAIVLLITADGDSYGLAGIVTAIYIVAAAIGGPIQGKLADAIGQRSVLLTAATLFGSGVVVFLWSTSSDRPIWFVFASAFLAGLGAPQAGSLMRARWTALLKPQPRLLQTAFAFEAVIDEVVFIIGPIIATVIATTISPELALFVSMITGLTGSVSLALMNSTAPIPHRQHHIVKPPIPLAFIVPVVAVGFGLGMIFGATEIIVVAFTTERDAREVSGLVLGAWAFGSLLAGVLVGAFPPPRDQLRRLQLALAGLTLTFAPLVFIDSIAFLTLALFLGGFLIAPSLIASVSLIQKYVVPVRLTEGIAWSSMGMTVGVAPGAAISGFVIADIGVSIAFIVPIVAGIIATLGAWIAIPWALPRLGLNPEPRPSSTSESVD